MKTASIPCPFAVDDLCRWCGMHHAGACLRVRALEYHPDGSLRRVEFHEPAPPVKIEPVKPAIGPTTTWRYNT